MKKLHLAVWLVAGCCALSLSCDNDSSTTPQPAPPPPAPPAPPPPPPPPEPADVAGDWVLTHDPGAPASVEPSEGCFVTEEWNATRGTGTPQMEPDRVIQIEQDGEDLSGYAWALEEDQEPTGLSVDDAGWRLVGTATPDAISLSATDRKRMGEWDPYPYSAGEFPTAQFLQGKCPEYGEATIQIQPASAGWEMTVQEDGSVSGGVQHHDRVEDRRPGVDRNPGTHTVHRDSRRGTMTSAVFCRRTTRRDASWSSSALAPLR